MTFRTVLIVMVAVCLSCVAAQASVYTWSATWNGTNQTYVGNWSSAGNWTPAGGPPGSADSVVIMPYNNNTATLTLDAGEQVTNLTFGGNNVGCVNFYGYIPLTVAGANTLTVTGAFNYNLFGITPFAPLLSGVAPTVTQGSLWLQNNADNFVGPVINVAGGNLIVNNDTGLGDPGNTLTLGSAGRFGGIGEGDGPWLYDTYNGNTHALMQTTPIARNITLAGNGGVLIGESLRFGEYTGTISGSGQLLVETGMGGGGGGYAGGGWGANYWTWDYFTLLDGNNTGFTGGMIVANGGIAPGGTTTVRYNGDDGKPYTVNGGNATNDVYGTGDIHVVENGVLAVDSANNFGPSATIYVNTIAGGGLAVGMTRDYMPPIDPSSNGTILVGNFGSTNVNNVLGSTTVPVGDGTMWLGSLSTYGLHAANPSCEYGGTSLAAMILNDPTHTYKLAGGFDTVLQLGDPGWANGGTGRSGVNAVLKDLDGGSTVCNVVIGRAGVEAAVDYGTYIRLLDANTYTGTTTINPGVYAEVMDYRNGSGIGGAGAGGGDMFVYGPGGPSDAVHNGTYVSFCIRGLNDNGGSGAAMVNKGNLTFNGPVNIEMYEDAAGNWGNPNGNAIAQMTVTGLTRSGRSVLGLVGSVTTIGASNELFFDTNQATDAPLTNNMVPAYIWNAKNNEFLTYGANGFQQLTTGGTNVFSSLASTPATGIAYVGSDTVSGGAQTVYALRTTGAISGGTLTVGDGVNPAGVMLATSSPQTANFAFGTSEGVIYVPSGNTPTISGTISGSNGFTKGGSGNLYLTADNTSTLSGDVTVDGGGLVLTNSNQVGTGRVVLNGGVLYLEVASTFTPEINLGPSGGTIDIVPWYGRNVNSNITGSGFLQIPYDNDYITLGGNNTYSGGTYMSGACRVIVNAGSSLGTGPVYMATAGNPTDTAGNQDVLILYGATNLAANRLVMLANDALVQVSSNGAAQIGSIEGVGMIQLGVGATNGIQVGGNNLSTDYFGRIMIQNASYASSGLTKVGTGTLTLWGDNSYTGTTTVSNGTLVNNNYINGSVYVTPGGVGTGHGASAQNPIYTGTGTTAGNVVVYSGGQVLGNGIFKGGVSVVGGTADLTNAAVSSVWVSEGNYTGTSTITGGDVTIAGGLFNGAHTINVPSIQVVGGTFDGDNTITGDVYTDRDEYDSGGTIQGTGTIHGNVNIWSGVYNGTHAITGNVDVEDYWGSQGDGNFASTFAGKTTISGNVTLGSIGSTGAVNFNGGHTIAGSLTVVSGNTQPVAICPHNSSSTGNADTLTVGGGLTLDHNTKLNFSLATPGTVGGGINDLIDVTGSVSLDGTLNVNALTGFGPGTYTLLTYTGTLTGTLAWGTMPAGFNYTLASGTLHTGTVYDLNLTVASNSVAGDVNGDGVVNSLDIDAIYKDFSPGFVLPPRPADVNGDGYINQLDVTYELHTYFHTNYADANLDRKTDFVDFQILLDHWQASGPSIGWAQGDFDGSGTVDFLDFQKLLDYWNPGGWNFAPAQAPEPASLSLLALGGLALLRRRK